MSEQLLLLAGKAGNLLLNQQLTIGTAESCTGGLLASYLTDISGSSTYVMGGVVTYSNELKMKFLNVRAETLAEYGAVSEPTAQEMAMGALDLLGTDIALSITGIAGPGGGSPDKPVGLVYIGIAWRQDTSVLYTVNRYQWNGTRIENKEASVKAALELLLDIFE